jgi:hypothetical protein
MAHEIMPGGRISRVILAAMMVFLLCCCSQGSGEIRREPFEVFTGFVFVGSSPYDPSVAPTGIPETLPQHGTLELPLPDHPQVRIQYVFHHRHPVDNETLAVTEIPARLRRLGITVVKAPRSGNELMYLFLGGPLFRIQIKDGNHEGMIYNQIDPDLVKASEGNEQWAKEDYVLVWLK